VPVIVERDDFWAVPNRWLGFGMLAAAGGEQQRARVTVSLNRKRGRMARGTDQSHYVPASTVSHFTVLHVSSWSDPKESSLGMRNVSVRLRSCLGDRAGALCELRTRTCWHGNREADPQRGTPRLGTSGRDAGGGAVAGRSPAATHVAPSCIRDSDLPISSEGRS
jgi:hypothetical protein